MSHSLQGLLRSDRQIGNSGDHEMTAWQCFIVRPYVRLELPKWERFYHRMVGNHQRDALWVDEPRRRSRGKLHKYEMELDLTRASERFTYFSGRFYELGMQLLLMELIRTGDRVVDIGAMWGRSRYSARAVAVPKASSTPSSRIRGAQPDSLGDFRFAFPNAAPPNGPCGRGDRTVPDGPHQ